MKNDLNNGVALLPEKLHIRINYGLRNEFSYEHLNSFFWFNKRHTVTDNTLKSNRGMKYRTDNEFLFEI